MNELQSQITLALVVPYVLQWLKGQSWFPLLSYYSGKLNRSVAFFIAALGGIGIGVHFDYTLHELVVTGLSWTTIWAGVQHVTMQFFMQHAAYRTLIAPPLPGAQQPIPGNVANPALAQKTPGAPQP